MIQLNSIQAQNAVMGLTGFTIIRPNQMWQGDFFTMRVWDIEKVQIWEKEQDIKVDEPLDLSDLASVWLPGQYFPGAIGGIRNYSDFPILAYHTGTRQPKLIQR